MEKNDVMWLVWRQLRLGISKTSYNWKSYATTPFCASHSNGDFVLHRELTFEDHSIVLVI